MKLFGVISTTTLFLLLGIAVPAGAQQEHQGKQEAKPPKQEQPAKPEKQQQAKGHQDQQRQQHQQQEQNKQRQQAKEQQDRQRQQHQQQEQNRQQQAKGHQDQQRQQHQQQEQNKQRQQAKEQQDRQRQQHQQQENARQQQQRAQQQHHEQHADRPPQREHHEHEAEERGAWQQHRAHSWRAEHRTWQQRGGYNGYRIPDDRFRGHFGRVHGFRIYRLPMVVVGGYPRFQYGGYWFSLVDPWPEYWSANWYENDDVYIDYYGDGYYLYNRRHPGVRLAISVYLN